MGRFSLKAVAVLCASAALSGCATTVVSGPPFDLDPALAGGVFVGDIEYDLSAPLNDVSDEFRDTFTDEFGWALAACARGRQTLDLRVRLDGVQRVQALTAARSGGTHRLRGVVEFVRPGTTDVVGRYAIEAEADAGQGLGALLTDQEAEISEAFGKALCRQARLWRLTPGR
ncbi:hypothetical protein [Caulobacter sp. 17J65-9]|uniref:hypothetical protein n=1 Tax=Caulobacter sp. 17J65-9 TaxID=2709382 RepID=UPI0013CA3A38|nr:hypothetical protein [Caulobacter sp. 17J65-9]NEX93284.1 hypothetical protein [Caulobacter sp. 17J65-9]